MLESNLQYIPKKLNNWKSIYLAFLFDDANQTDFAIDQILYFLNTKLTYDSWSYVKLSNSVIKGSPYQVIVHQHLIGRYVIMISTK